MRTLAIVFASLTLTACGSLTKYRQHIAVEGPERTVQVVIEPHEVVGPQLSMLKGEIFLLPIYWPADMVISTCMSAAAMFDSEVHIEGGPLGWLQAVVVPGATAIPGIVAKWTDELTPRSVPEPDIERPRRLRVDAKDIDALLAVRGEKLGERKRTFLAIARKALGFPPVDAKAHQRTWIIQNLWINP